ncbi:MAG: hypothetical protein ACYTXE_32520 [Nostoc sp.]
MVYCLSSYVENKRHLPKILDIFDQLSGMTQAMAFRPPEAIA